MKYPPVLRSFLPIIPKNKYEIYEERKKLLERNFNKMFINSTSTTDGGYVI